MGDSQIMLWKDRLRQERIRRNWRQSDLAEQLGTTVLTIQRWERGSHQPGAYFRVKLSALFGKSLEERESAAPYPLSSIPPENEVNISAEASPYPSRFPEVWNVPYARNFFFTGRENTLSHVFKLLHREHTEALTQPLALSGLGGVGKTQIALEYAYRYRQQYRFVFWTNAATWETIMADIACIASLLQLPECQEQDQIRVLQAVRRWFTIHNDWLWILDNVGDVATVHSATPQEQSGHLLFTSRTHALGQGACSRSISGHSRRRTAHSI
jgi:transcriptional regulator with XRE-family HTH domain